mgnify:CR=1 FL=1
MADSKELRLFAISCKTFNINSYNPKTSKIKEPETPGKSIALIAANPPKKTYNKVGVTLAGIRKTREIPIISPINARFGVGIMTLISRALKPRKAPRKTFS